jgi:hypothetical protein
MQYSEQPLLYETTEASPQHCVMTSEALPDGWIPQAASVTGIVHTGVQEDVAELEVAVEARVAEVVEDILFS